MMIQIGTNGLFPVSVGSGASASVLQNTSGQTSFEQVLQNTVAAPKTLDSIFSQAAEQYQVPENLLKAIAKAESGFRTDAVSSCGAGGVMQLMPATAKSLGVTDVFDPEQNIMGGAKYISGLLQKYNGDVKLALAAYNAGSGNVAKYGGVPPFTETQNYVKKVMSYLGQNTVIPDAQNYSTASASAAITSGNQVVNAFISNGPAEVQPLEDETFTYEDYQLFIQLFLAQVQQEADKLGEQSRNERSGLYL